MSGYKVIVFDNGEPSYVAGSFESLIAAEQIKQNMLDETYLDEDGRHYVFDGTDEIVVIDPTYRATSVWIRRDLGISNDYQNFDFEAYVKEWVAKQNRVLVGFKITDEDGNTVQGTDKDPFKLNANDVLKDGAVIAAKIWAADKGFEVREVWFGDVQDPNFVYTIEEVKDNKFRM